MVKISFNCRLLAMLIGIATAFTSFAQGYSTPSLPWYGPNPPFPGGTNYSGFPSDTNYTGFPGTNAILAVYPLDGNGKDASGRGFDGTLFGTAPAPDRFGRTNGALNFNGVSDYIDLGNRPEFNFTNGFALTAWIKVDPSARNSYVIGKYDTTGPFSNESHSYGLGLHDTLGAYGFVLGDGSSYIDALGPRALNDGQWHVMTLSYEDGVGFRLYADGQLAGLRNTGDLPPFVNNYPLLIGKITTGWHFAGTIDDVTVHGRALSDSEVRLLHQYQRFYQSENPVLLSQPTATFSQTEGSDFSISKAVDGVITDNLGWAIAYEFRDQAAVFETVADSGFPGGTLFKFSLLFNYDPFANTGHTLGKFRLSVTTDPRDTFADGLSANGDVSANWTPLAVKSAVSEKGATCSILPDNSILVSGNHERVDTYTVTTATRLTGITGIRLETLQDPSLPANGPGREVNGNFVLSEMFVAARPGGGPLIANQPASTKVIVGGSATLAVSATSSLPVTYQWFRNGAPLPGATNATLLIENANFGHAGTYAVQVDNAEGSTLSAGAVLNVLAPDTTGAATLTVLNKQPTNAPISDIVLNLLSGPRYLAQAYAGISAETLAPAGPAVPFLSGEDAGYFTQIDLVLTNIAPGEVVFVQVRTWDSTGGASYEEAVQNGGQRGNSQVLSNATGGGQIPTPQLAGLTPFSLVAPLKILSQPANQEIFVGQDARFEIEPWGSAPLSFQWFLNSNVIAGATASTLVLTNVQLEQSGAYHVIVTNSLGSATSTVATLTVKVPDRTAPEITLTSPVAGETFDERVTLSGSISDNEGVARAEWELNGAPGGQLQLENGRFSVTNILLARGPNLFRVTATDPSTNVSSGTVSVTNRASRVVFVEEILPHQEGARVRVPLVLSSHGNVAGLTFILSFNRNVLTDPEIEWSEILQGAITQANTNFNGYRGSFALSGTPLPTGAVHFATVVFRSRSVPVPTTVPLQLSVSGISDANGNPLSSTGTDVRSGNVQITRRKFIGDNNANDRLDINDATTIMRFANFVETPRSWDITGNDLNATSQLDAGDVVRVLRAVVGLDPQPSRAAPALRRLSATGARVALQIDKQQASPGEQVKITVNLGQMSGPLSGASFKLNYPVAALRFKNATGHRTGSMVPAGGAVIWNLSPAQNDYAAQDGAISLAVTTDGNWSTSQGVLAEFTFTVQPGATNQYRWPITLSQAELSSAYDLVPATGSEVLFVGRQPRSPRFEGTPTLANGTFTVPLNAETGVQYRIEVSDNLVDWTLLKTVTGSGSGLDVADSVSALNARRFYRATQVE